MIRNPNLKDPNLRTALMLAACNNHLDFVVLLMEREEMDVNAQNRFNETALHLAVANNHPAIVAQLLRDDRIHCSLKNRMQRTPLKVAIDLELPAIVAQLLSDERVGGHVLAYRAMDGGEVAACSRLYFPKWRVLREALRSGFDVGARAGQEGSFAIQTRAGTRLTHKFFHGYNSYGKTHADHLNPKEQAKFTTVLPGDRVELYRAAIGGFSHLLDFCDKKIAGSFEFLSAHILRQDSPQARFRWHRDTDGDTPHHRQTFVFMLTNTTSWMQVRGCPMVHYLGGGSGVVFRSSDEHRSGHADPGTMKIALFYGINV